MVYSRMSSRNRGWLSNRAATALTGAAASRLFAPGFVFTQLYPSAPRQRSSPQVPEAIPETVEIFLCYLGFIAISLNCL